MPPIARIIASGYLHHITSRGNNRATVFCDDEGQQACLTLFQKQPGSFPGFEANA